MHGFICILSTKKSSQSDHRQDKRVEHLAQSGPTDYCAETGWEDFWRNRQLAKGDQRLDKSGSSRSCKALVKARRPSQQPSRQSVWRSFGRGNPAVDSALLTAVMSLASPAQSGVTASSVRTILDKCIAENMAAIQVNNDKAFLTRSFAARSVCEDIRAQLVDYQDDDLVDVAAIRLPADMEQDFLPAELG